MLGADHLHSVVRACGRAFTDGRPRGVTLRSPLPSRSIGTKVSAAIGCPFCWHRLRCTAYAVSGGSNGHQLQISQTVGTTFHHAPARIGTTLGSRTAERLGQTQCSTVPADLQQGHQHLPMSDLTLTPTLAIRTIDVRKECTERRPRLLSSSPRDDASRSRASQA